MEYLTPVQAPEQWMFTYAAGVRGNRLIARGATEITAMGLDPETIAIQDSVLRNVIPA